jgi:hypothetical protein
VTAAHNKAIVPDMTEMFFYRERSHFVSTDAGAMRTLSWAASPRPPPPPAQTLPVLARAAAAVMKS